MLSCRAIASAVSAWSPVIIFTRMPARWQVFTAATARGRGGSIMPTRPRNSSPVAMSSAARLSESVIRRPNASTRMPWRASSLAAAAMAPRSASASSVQAGSSFSSAPLQ